MKFHPKFRATRPDGYLKSRKLAEEIQELERSISRMVVAGTRLKVKCKVENITNK